MPAIITYLYDPVGNQMRVEHANGVFSHYAYDERNILTKLTHENLVNEQPVEVARFDYPAYAILFGACTHAHPMPPTRTNAAT